MTRSDRRSRLRHLPLGIPIAVATLWCLHAWIVFWGGPMGLASASWYWPVGVAITCAVITLLAKADVHGWARHGLKALVALMGVALLVPLALHEDTFQFHCQPIPNVEELPQSMVAAQWRNTPLTSSVTCTLRDVADEDPLPDLVWHVSLYEIKQGIIPTAIEHFAS